jgi:DNA topoisomerase IA
MRVVLAEKPSVARELASFLRASARHDGYFEGNGYQVTWALGHATCGLSNAEAAQVLGIRPSAAVNRYVRALRRLRDVFQGMPGGIEGAWG